MTTKTGAAVMSHNQFSEKLQTLRTIRRETVAKIVNDQKIEWNPVIAQFQNILNSFQRCLIDQTSTYEASFDVGNNSQMIFNIKDELLSIEKDIAVLKCCSNKNKIDHADLITCLQQYHPVSADVFREEASDLTIKLKKYCKEAEKDKSDRILDWFITDWDGTFKTYGTNYSTCMQPAYSSIILILAYKHICKSIAVLTAGPLSGPGILDLTSLNPNDPINIGGSWGREWLINDDKNPKSDSHERQKIVDTSCFDEKNEKLFKILKNDVKKLLETPEFSRFVYVGSGYQEKVDRITLATQDVNRGVKKELVEKYLKEVESVLRKHDEHGEFFELHHGDLDVEIVVKNLSNSKSNSAWSKRDGLETLFKAKKATLQQNDRILLCGDTTSDVPMLKYLKDEMKVQPFVVFVNPSDQTKKLLQKEICENCLSIVGCPEVLHVALLSLIDEKMRSHL